MAGGPGEHALRFLRGELGGRLEPFILPPPRLGAVVDGASALVPAALRQRGTFELRQPALEQLVRLVLTWQPAYASLEGLKRLLYPVVASRMETACEFSISPV